MQKISKEAYNTIKRWGCIKGVEMEMHSAEFRNDFRSHGIKKQVVAIELKELLTFLRGLVE